MQPARNLLLLTAGITISLAACGSGSTDATAGTGGTPGAGGTLVTRGNSQTGAAGASNAVGGTSRGGAESSGGSTFSAGAPGTGGAAPSTGGAAPSGGKTGTGGTPGAGGTPIGGGTPSVGGATSNGGATGSGGTMTSGGATSQGGSMSIGGAGDSATGGGGVSTGGAQGNGGASTAGGEAGSAGASGAGGQEPAACPRSMAPWVAGDQVETLQHEGRARTYILHVPSGVTDEEPLALVFDLHGAYGSGSSQQQTSGWSALADKEGFLAVFPDGVDGYWNVDDTCCGTAGAEKIDDVGFIRAMIDEIHTQHCVDPSRIYVSGFSNGGGLTHRMGCDAADVIAAVAPVDTDLRTSPCNPARPISMLEVRGLADSLEPYAGGIVGPEGGQYNSPGAQGSLKLWADINQCTGAATALRQYCEGYTECAEGVETDLCSLPGVDHGSYGNSLNFDIASVAWEMFQRHPMR
jgi:poly(3-hydroxybutyrate) depolymerase